MKVEIKRAMAVVFYVFFFAASSVPVFSSENSRQFDHLGAVPSFEDLAEVPEPVEWAESEEFMADEEGMASVSATDPIVIDLGGMAYSGFTIGALGPGSWRDHPMIERKRSRDNVYVRAGNPEAFDDYPPVHFRFTFKSGITPGEKLDSLTPGQPAIFRVKSPVGRSFYQSGRNNATDMVLHDVRPIESSFYSTESYVRYPDGIEETHYKKAKDKKTYEKGFVFEVLRRKNDFSSNVCYIGLHRGGKDYFLHDYVSFFERVLRKRTERQSMAHIGNVIWFVTKDERVCKYAEDAAKTMQKVEIISPFRAREFEVPHFRYGFDEAKLFKITPAES